MEHLTFEFKQTTTLTPQLIEHYTDIFWNSVYQQLIDINPNIHLLLLCKVRFDKNVVMYRTLADMKAANFEDKALFSEFISERLGILADSYRVDPIIELVFSYREMAGKAPETRALKQKTPYQVTQYNFNNLQLPLTFIPEQYGEVLAKEKTETGIRYVVSRDSLTFVIDCSADRTRNNVYITGAIDLKWVDTMLEGGIFKRELGKNILYIREGSILVKTKELSAKPFRKILKDPKLITGNFMTIDIETVSINGSHKPYLICGFDGNDYIHEFAQDLSHESRDIMFTNFIHKITPLEHVKYVYAHNLSGFDGILIFRYLLNIDARAVKPIIFKGKLMAIKFKVGNRTIVFKDSYLLLPKSLRALANSFKVESIKSFFPFNLTDINYVGEFPTEEYWTNIEQFELETLKHEFISNGKLWSFKEESIKYCKLDCKCLYEILIKFNKLIYKHFHINIHGPLSLSSLAMKIFKVHYMPKDTIYQLLGDVERDIREAYTGGAVDVYRHHNFAHNEFCEETKHNIELQCLDVNSLYPYIMKTMNMPIGKPIAFEGDIRAVDKEAHGFFYCNIDSPNIDHPILQRRIKTKDGMRTVAGLGIWDGWITSLEYDVAKKLGYSIKILKGYKFKQANLFSGYVDKLYTLRKSYPSHDPMNMVAKLLLNSLYGKFGMKSETVSIDIFDTKDILQFEQLNQVFALHGDHLKDCVEIDEYFIIVRPNLLKNIKEGDEDVYHGTDVNVGIAATVTAGGRCYMSNFKNNPHIKLYYSDTDSIIISGDINPDLIGNELGQFKVEHIIKVAYFLAPKVYGFLNKKGEVVIKVKGLSNEALKYFGLRDLENLLFSGADYSFETKKMFKSLYDSEITVRETAYLLRATNNKRISPYTPCITRDGSLTEKCLYKTYPYRYDDIIVDKISTNF